MEQNPWHEKRRQSVTKNTEESDYEVLVTSTGRPYGEVQRSISRTLVNICDRLDELQKAVERFDV